MVTIKEYLHENGLDQNHKGCERPKKLITKQKISEGLKLNWIKRRTNMKDGLNIPSHIQTTF